MPQLDPTWFASQLFWLAIAFFTLYVVLARFALPPLLAIIEQRKEKVAGDLALAQRFKTEAEAARLDYERALADARSQAQQVMVDVAAQYKAKAEHTGREMDMQIAKQLSEAEQRIAAKKAELFTTLTPATTELAQMIVEKLTGQIIPTAGKLSALKKLSKGGA